MTRALSIIRTIPLTEIAGWFAIGATFWVLGGVL